jgi:hypothetical protein
VPHQLEVLGPDLAPGDKQALGPSLLRAWAWLGRWLRDV